MTPKLALAAASSLIILGAALAFTVMCLVFTVTSTPLWLIGAAFSIVIEVIATFVFLGILGGSRK